MRIFVERAFAVAFLVACTLALSVAAYWTLIDTASPITSVSVELLNEDGKPQTEFKRGEMMLIARDNCSTRHTQVFISRQMRRVADAFSYTLPSGPYYVDPGCDLTINAIAIPHHAVPGRYEYLVTMEYQNNPLNSGRVLLKVPELTVLP